MSADRSVRRHAVPRRPRRLARQAVGAILAVALAGCASLSRHGERSAESIAQPVAPAPGPSLLEDAARFEPSPLPEVLDRGIFPVRRPPDCEVAVLVDGQQALAHRLALIAAARHTIRIQTLIFKGDESGQRIADALKRRRADGVEITLIVDALSNPWPSAQAILFDLRQHGIEVLGFEAFGFGWFDDLPWPQRGQPLDPTMGDKRFHEKLWIIDAGTPFAAAIAGGLNVGNEYFRADPSRPSGYWRDQDVALRGAIVDDLAAGFDRNRDYLLTIRRSRGLFDSEPYWQTLRGVLGHTGSLPVPRSADPRIAGRVDAIARSAPSLDYHAAICRFVHHRPRFGETYLHQAYLKLIASARDELVIANAYFVPTATIRTALKEAARRCVAITLLTNSPETNDLPEISLVGRGYFRELLAAADARDCPSPDDAGREGGIRILEWTGRASGDPLAQGTMHAKFAVADRRVALVGSYNLDPRSERLNGETAIVFEQAAVAAQLARAVLERDARYSREITPAEAAGFEDPEDLIDRFRVRLGRWFEDEF